jgi:hypothetical protein
MILFKTRVKQNRPQKIQVWTIQILLSEMQQNHESQEIENYINKELAAIGFPAINLENTRETFGSIFSLLKQRQVSIC